MRLLYLAPIVFLVGLFFIPTAHAQQTAERCKVVGLAIETLKTNHYLSREYDSTLSASTFDFVFYHIDNQHLFLTKQDSLSLLSYRSTLFEGANYCNFIADLSKLFSKRILLLKDNIATLQAKKTFAPSKKNFESATIFKQRATNDEDLFVFWRDFLEFYTLHSVYESCFENGALSAKATEQYFDSTWQSRVGQMVCRLDKYHADSIKTYDFIATNFAQALAKCYDPHSSFFTKRTFNRFVEELSKVQVSYGFALQEEEDGSFTIAAIEPGSAAWKSNKLHIGDKLKSIVYADKAMNLECVSVEAIMSKLTEEKPETIVLTVQKESGENIEMELPQEEISNENNIVKGYIIERDSMKLGYINIATFYSSWDDDPTQSMANDVAKEILKLTRSGIKGLILDMRYNGGGAVYEAIQLAGSFIDIGPVAMESFLNEKPTILKDFNRGMVYAGPLAIMVNGWSASATEMVAGTLQDYNRALIVGDRTYGKGSSQVVIPLIDSGFTDTLGFVKVTKSLLFRVNSDTHQGKGVTPDIELPDFWASEIDHEDKADFFITPQKLEKTLTYNKHDQLPLESLIDNSKARLQQDSLVQAIFATKEKWDQSQAASIVYVLDKKLFQKGYEREVDVERIWDELPSYSRPAYTVSNHAYDTDYHKVDAFKKKLDEEVKKQIVEDWKILETYSILRDLIQLTTP